MWCPVVASNVGGVSEIITDVQNGKLLETNSPRHLAVAISQLLQDEYLLKQLGTAGRETIKKKFTWSVNIEKYYDVYSDAIE